MKRGSQILKKVYASGPSREDPNNAKKAKSKGKERPFAKEEHEITRHNPEGCKWDKG